MKIGLIVPVGRTDKYGYQYDNFTNIFLESFEKFADNIKIISSSRYANKEIFSKFKKIDFISDEKTWFKLDNKEEIFSLDTFSKNLNYGRDILRDEGYDVVQVIAINTYIPESSFKNLRRTYELMIKNNKYIEYVYKKYLCGNLNFNADRKIPNIFNLLIENPWEKGVDSVINTESSEIIKMVSGNFKKWNDIAVIDVPWELTIKDGMEKYEFVIKEYRKINNTYDPNNLDNLKFNEVEWLKYYQKKVNQKTLANELLDEVAKKILSIRKENFISNILEANYEPPKKQNLITKAKKKAKEIIKSR